MKKLFVLLLMVSLVFCVNALAEDLGVQVIGGDTDGVPCTLDDLQLNMSAVVDGICEITVTKFEYRDVFLEQVKGLDVDKWGGIGWSWRGNNIANMGYADLLYITDEGETRYYTSAQVVRNDSGSQADYAMLYMNILNTGMVDVQFIEKAKVKVVYDDTNEFAGWVRQYDMDMDTTIPRNPADNFPIAPYYAGYYVFGCTLPNAVIERDAPLRMEITLGDIELTYHIRK